jgi:LmbE family N-acetylglucosaminyl deacetylase
MKAGEYFDLVDALPLGSWHDLTGGKPFVVLSPHPDDESLGVGGLIALARRSDQAVAVILLTDGSRSHPNSVTHPADRLIALRRSELVAAARILGLESGRLYELGLRDGAAPVSGPEFDRAVERVSAIVADVGAGSLFVTWEHDPHCDHEAAARLAREVRRRNAVSDLKLWHYPVWGWHLPKSHAVQATAPSGLCLAIEDVLLQKRAAIEAHVSQMTDLIDDDPEGFRFTAETLKPFLRNHEFYIEDPVQ